jgi:hypothetical protein
MKVLATLLLSLSLPGTHFAPPPRTPAHHEQRAQQARKGGTWYFAQTGHAVFCYGPVMIVPQTDGSLQRVATFCKDGQTMVPLKD